MNVIHVVQEIVSIHCGITREEMVSKVRAREVCWPRQLAIYISVKLLGGSPFGSLPSIGKQFGGLDHTTILWACKQVERHRAERRRPWVGDLDALTASCAQAIGVHQKERLERITSWQPPEQKKATELELPPPPPETARREVQATYYRLLQAYKRMTVRYPAKVLKELPDAEAA